MDNREFIRMLSEATNTKKPLNIEDSPGKQFGHNEISEAKANDRLIALDFRAIGAPSFESWITDNRKFRKGKHLEDGIEYDYFDFDWSLVNDRLFATIKVNILDNHDSVHDVFRRHAAGIAPSTPDPRLSHVWKPYKKDIGTVCARTAISTFFVYENVFVDVRAVPILPRSNLLHDILSDWTDERLVPKSPSGDPWDMLIAEWIYGILKAAPSFKVFPAEPRLR
ncbi:MAG: hypothetical protein LBV29_06480 [Azoarcus sp.]|jgi:hypothetical protein|nr:hypothetical protein [Azoarcus sp.]